MTVKNITIALISSSTEEFKRFSVPRYFLVLAGMFIITCGLYLGWVVINYQILKSKMPLLVQLQRENEQQRIEFANLANHIQQMRPKASQNQEPDPIENGFIKLKPVGNGENGPSRGGNHIKPALLSSDYSVGGGESPEENEASVQAVTPVLVSANGDRRGLPDKIPTPGNQKPTSLKKLEPYPYSLQIGSYRTLKRANKAILIYRKKNLSPYWVRVDLGENGIWFRVFVGHFRDKEKAKFFRHEHRITSALIKRIAYANLIGIYSVEEQFEGEFLLLGENGHFPYVIKDEQDMFRLFVGAFFTRAGVEKQHANLLAQGINSDIVKR